MRYVLVFVVALAVRLAVIAATSDMAIVRAPSLDSRQYLVWAGWILDGRFVWPQPTVQGPGYPLLLAAFLAITGKSLSLVASLQAAVGALSAVLTMAIADRWFDRTTALAAGLLQASYAPLALAEVSILVEGPFVLLLSAFVFVFVTRGESTRGMFASGVLAGLAAIFRATALPLAVAFVIFDVRRQREWRQRRQRVGAFLLGLVTLTMPVALKNAIEGGGFTLQGKGGFNFWIGNTPVGEGLATFRLGKGWDEIESEAARAGVENGAAQNRFYIRKAIGEIARSPLGWLGVLANKAAWSTQHEEVRDSLSFYFYAETAPWLRWLPGFGLLFALAAGGALAAARTGSMPPPLTLWTSVSWLTLVLLVVGYRYRLPLVPPLVILAASGTTALARTVRARAWQSAAALAVVMLTAGTVSQARVHAASHVFAEELAFTGHALLAERRFSEAEAKYREAIAADPDMALPWIGLGSRFYNVGKFDEARAAYVRAVDIDPYFANAWLRLAWIEARHGRAAQAVSYCRKAASIYPFDVEIRAYLARYLFDMGDAAGAEAELHWVLERRPDDTEVKALLQLAKRRRGSSN